MITADDLHRIAAGVNKRAAKYAPLLSDTMTEFEIDTGAREAAFLAQLLHESCCFLYTREIASGDAYEGRADLGNTQPGDGPRFRGRGLIQITGRANYLAAGEALSVDLLSNPEQLEEPELATRSAGWFWRVGAGLRLSRAAKARLGSIRDLNELADKGDFVGITMAINGGTNGLAARQAYWTRAQQVLGG